MEHDKPEGNNYFTKNNAEPGAYMNMFGSGETVLNNVKAQKRHLSNLRQVKNVNSSVALNSNVRLSRQHLQPNVDSKGIFNTMRNS